MQILHSTLASDLQIVKVSKEGGPTKEYVVLRAFKDCNLNDYAISDNTYDEEGHTSNKHPHFYWFPKLEVKRGDFIYLYTGRGSYRNGKTESGTPYHMFFWQLGVSVWNDQRDNAVLLKVSEAQRKAV
jgi:hypothetical protein